MKTVLFLFMIVMAMTLYGQHYDYGDLDTTIYNPETGQYWYRSQQFDESENILTSEEFFMGNQIRHRFQLEGLSKFPGSSLGFWAKGTYLQPVVKQDWVNRGYSIPSSYNLEINLALRYEKNGIGPFLGIGMSTGKRYVGPLLGIIIDRPKWSLKATGLYSVFCVYKAEYSQEWLDQHQELIAFGDPIVIDGFDPNSWYHLTFKYSLNERFNLGIVSERFYGTRIMYEYVTGLSGLHFSDVKLMASVGRDFEFKFNVASFVFSSTIF